MKEIKIEIKTEPKYRYEYEAYDGTIFSEQKECERYENSALCVLSARFNKLIVSKDKDAWELMRGYDDHTVTAIKLSNVEDITTVAQFMFLKCPWWSEDRKAQFYDEIEIAFNNKDLYLIGTNTEGEIYVLGPRQNIINNLLNLDKDESFDSSK